jgi:hypothetical protein
MIDWQPLILAGAVLITAIAAAIPGLVVSLQNRRTLGRVETQTNSHLTAANERIAALEREIAVGGPERRHTGPEA